MKRHATGLTILAASGLFWAALAGSGTAGEDRAAAKDAGSPAREADLVAKALEASGGAEEVVFAVRGLYQDGHYYANFGHWSLDPNRMMYLVALDENDLSVKNMQSFCSVMPGETLGCVGCHESRAQTAPTGTSPLALEHQFRKPEPIAGVPEIIDYPRDIQPIWNRHCVHCHSAERPDGRIILTGDHNEWFSQSYYTLFAEDQVSDGWGYLEDGNRAPRGLGSGASRLMKTIDGSHYQAELSATERSLVRLWLDCGAAYPGTYAAIDSGTAAVKMPGSVLERRCASCHPAPPKDDRESVIAGPRMYGGEPLLEGGGGRPTTVLTGFGPRIQKVRGLHTRTGYSNVPDYCLNLYNLTCPEKSLILMAPLATSAGGYGWCRAKSSGEAGQSPPAVFGSREDRDYQAILDAIALGGKTLQGTKRFDMPGFRPNQHYVREMKRYGILPPECDATKDVIDVYATDQAYWRSLWHQPTVAKTTAADIQSVPRTPLRTNTSQSVALGAQ